MRDSFVTAVTELASIDSSIILLTGDLGFGVFDEFESKFPNNFINVGISEQNMIGIASGLSKEGFKVIAYSIGNFPTFRCLEQIRNDACYHNLNITIVTVGAGFSYGSLGMTHHATEDIGIMRSLPNMTISSPSSSWETYEMTKYLINLDSPSYLRLDKSEIPIGLKPKNYKFEFGKFNQYSYGDDLSIFATGGIMVEAIKAVEILLEKHEVSVSLFSVDTIKPLDTNEINKALKNTKAILTLEEHNILGGMGSAIAEYCMEKINDSILFKRLGLRDTFTSVVGDQSYLRSYYSLDANSIVEESLGLIKLA